MLLRRREVSARDLAETCLARIEALDGRLNAFITVTRVQALARAHEMDAELSRGRDRGPLHGIPYALKDVIATRGILTTNGSQTSKDWVPAFDATVQARLEAAGGVLVGKLNLWELAMSGAAYGEVRNPWALEYSPGGSSSGAGAAVAARLVPVAIGTDTGGSIRVPAAHCGVVGLRPTYGRVSRYGVTANAWSVDTVGPLTTSVDGTALVLAEISGPDPHDRTSAARPATGEDRRAGESLIGLRIGIPRQHFFDGTHAEIERAVHAAVSTIEQLGARAVPIDLPHAGEAALARTLHLVEAASCHEVRLRTQGDQIGAGLRTRLERASSYAAIDYLKALRLRTVMMDEAKQAFTSCDVFIAPTDRGLPARIESAPSTATAGPTTFFASMTGLPALAVPCGFSSGSPPLPISMQLHAPPFGESVLFRVGRAYQQVTDWHARIPTI